MKTKIIVEGSGQNRRIFIKNCYFYRLKVFDNNNFKIKLSDKEKANYTVLYSVRTLPRRADRRDDCPRESKLFDYGDRISRTLR